jgi:hypothetical protein
VSGERPLRAIDGGEPVATPPRKRAITRGQVYVEPIEDGRVVRDTAWGRLVRRFQGATTSEGERREALLAGRLAELRPVTAAT